MEHGKFEHDEKVELVEILNEQIGIDGSTQYMINAIKFYVKSVFEALNENDISLIRFPSYEL